MAAVLLGFSCCFLCHLRMHKVPARCWRSAISAARGTCHSHAGRLPRWNSKFLSVIRQTFAPITLMGIAVSSCRCNCSSCLCPHPIFRKLVVALLHAFHSLVFISHHCSSQMSSTSMSVRVIAFQISQTTVHGEHRRGRGCAVLDVGSSWVSYRGFLRPFLSTSWVNNISFLPTDSSVVPDQAPRLCQFSLGNLGLRLTRSSAISSAHPLPVSSSEPQNPNPMGPIGIHTDMKWAKGTGCPLLYATTALQNTSFQYSWLLNGCNLAKFCMFMQWDYST